jgi:phosphate starvation-inducible membrane PsiE
MFTSIDSRHADSTGPHAELPPRIARIGVAVGAWVRIVLVSVIALMTLIGTLLAMIDIARTGRVTISDVLLMFIYLEIWAMIVIEATTRRLPVDFIIYIAITVLTRHLVGVAGDKSTSDIGLLMDAGAILILALAAVLLELKFFRPRRLRGSGGRSAEPSTQRPD